MSEGKVKAAIRLLSTTPSCGVLSLDSHTGPEPGAETVLESLYKKHPPGEVAQQDFIIPPRDLPPSHPIIFEDITANLIRAIALQTEGAAGPSGIDARGWKRMCTSFKSVLVNLCNSLALVAKRLCSEYVDPQGITALLACRLIALDKRPGVRPIGVCETHLLSQCMLSQYYL